MLKMKLVRVSGSAASLKTSTAKKVSAKAAAAAHTGPGYSSGYPGGSTEGVAWTRALLSGRGLDAQVARAPVQPKNPPQSTHLALSK